MNPIAWRHRLLPALGVAAIVLVATSGLPVPAEEPGCVESAGQTMIAGGTNGVAAIFAIDLDGDGDTDLLSASTNDDKIAWYENDGEDPPGYTERIITTLADGASSVHAADMDDDQDIDVLSASGNDDTIAWYENVPDTSGADPALPPTFVRHVISTTASNAASVYAVDLDVDGHMDVLAASIDDNEVAWYRQFEELDEDDQPTGTFAFEKFFVTSSASGASSVFAADINGDGEPDVLSASRYDHKIIWYERTVETDEEDNETTTFLRHDISNLADGARSVYAADLDGDKDIDVLSASSNDDEISWYENVPDPNPDGLDPPPPPTFTKRGISLDADGAASVFAIDLDGDLKIDVLSASQNDGKIAWYRNDGQEDPVFTEEVISLDAPGARSVYAAPIDDDENKDVLSASSELAAIALNDKIAWYANDGVGPGFTEQDPVSSGSIAPEVILGVDVDGDLKTDVIVGSSSDSSVAWYMNDGEDPPGFETRFDIAHDVDQPSALFWGDVDGDDLMDLLVASSGDDTIAWYRNVPDARTGDPPPPPTFELHVVTADADGASSVFAADIDGDEDVDILSASADDDKIAWYENVLDEVLGPEDPEFIEHIITADALGASSVFAANVDGDDDMDVLAASFDDNTIAWYENDVAIDRGAGEVRVFTKHVVSTATSGAMSVYAADMDGDGDVDVLSASANDDTISWHENGLDPDDPEQTIIPFTERGIDVFARFARVVLAADMDGDLDLDVVSASSGDDSVAWYENVPDPNPDDLDPPPPPTFEPHLITSVAESSRSVAVAKVDDDGYVDVLSAFLFGVAWHANNATEVCVGFDVNGDTRIDGVELIWLGRAFGESCEEGVIPWWLDVDTNDDCIVDGEDLAVLASSTVWGRYTVETEDTPLCHFTCQ